MEQSKKIICDIVDDMLQKKELLLAKSLYIPYFVISRELCKKASIPFKQGKPLIEEILIDKFGDQISFSKERAYHKYRNRMRRGLFVYNIDLAYNSEEIDLYTHQANCTHLILQRFCKTRLVFEENLICPCPVVYERVNAYAKKKKHGPIRPVDIKNYLFNTHQVSVLVHKRRLYKEEYYYGNFFVGLDLK